MSNALHDYAKLFERYAANNGGTGVILEGEDCLSLANEMWMVEELYRRTDYLSLHPITGQPIRLVRDRA